MNEQNANKIIKNITKFVMAAIESGNLGRWVKPWQNFGFPRNAKTKKQYGLINSFWLTESLARFGFTYPAWATENQWNSLGYSLQVGESAKTAVLYPCHVKFPIWSKKKGTVADIQEEQDEEPLYYKSYLVHKAFPILNIAQINVPESEYDLFVTKTIKNGPDRIERFVQSIEHKCKENGNDRATYVMSSDMILMPKREFFRSEVDYWSTYLHELGHWTGARHRLNRDFSNHLSSYAFEELVAELCSAIFAGEFGFSGELQHREYIGSWLRILENNPKAIIRAGWLAIEAVDYLKKEAKRGISSPTIPSKRKF